MSLLFTNPHSQTDLVLPLAIWRGGIKAFVDMGSGQNGSRRSYAGRARRGATLIGVSLLMIVAVGVISTFIRIWGEEAQQATALEAADIIAQHAANLDFWVHNERTSLAALLSAGGVISLNTAQTINVNQAPTSTPFSVASIRDWSIQYLVVQPTTETHPFGLVVARPQTPNAFKIARLVQTKIAERIGAAQLGGGLSEALDARGFATLGAGGGLATTDIAFFSYTLNGLNKDLVRREAFAGYSTPSINTDLSLGSNELLAAGDLDAVDGVVSSITATAGTGISLEDISLATAANVDQITVTGSGVAQALLAQDAQLSTVNVVNQTTAQSVETNQRATLSNIIISANTATAALYSATTINATTLSANTFNSPAMTVTTNLTAQTYTSWDRLTLEILDTDILAITGGCTGC